MQYIMVEYEAQHAAFDMSEGQLMMGHIYYPIFCVDLLDPKILIHVMRDNSRLKSLLSVPLLLRLSSPTYGIIAFISKSIFIFSVPVP